MATRRMFGRFNTKHDLTWEGLLPPSTAKIRPEAIVIEAGSGTGKSTEARTRAEYIRKEGGFAFYCEAKRAAANGLLAAFDGDDADAYRDWRSAPSPGILFVDAIDEVYLGHRTVDDLFRNLEREIDFATQPVVLVVTARTGTWSSHEASLLEKCLRRRRSGKLPEVDDGRKKKKADVEVDQPGQEPLIWTLTFEALDGVDAKVLSEFYGAADPDAFHAAFEESEIADFMELRPRDVKLFVQYWNRHGRLGTWSEIAGWLVTWTYQELNPARRRQSLSLEDYAAALKRVAAASALCKQNHIVLPTALALPGAMQACELFPDWSPSKLEELFASPLFVPKGESAVQLPSGAVTECLAALWIAQRYRADLDLEAIADALFVKAIDGDAVRLPDSRRALVGWTASLLPELRKQLRAVAPDVLLHFGDPARLDSREIVAAVDALIAQKAVRHWEWPTGGTLTRLARPELAGYFREILEGPLDPHLLWHLLRFAEAGSYRECLPRALQIAVQPPARDGSQTLAIRMVRKLGSDADKMALRALLETGESETKAALVAALVPKQMSASELSSMLVRGCDYNLALAFGTKCGELETSALDIILASIDTRLAETPWSEHQELHVNLNDESESGLAVAASYGLIERLRRSLPSRLPTHLGRLPVAVQVVADASYLDHDLIESLNQTLQAFPAVRRAVWRQKLVLLGRRHYLNNAASGVVAPLLHDDFGWLLAESAQARNENIRGLVRMEIQTSYDRLDVEARARVRLASRGALRELLLHLEEGRVAMSSAREAAERNSEKARAKRRRGNRNELLPKKDRIRDGSDMHALRWAWSQLKGNHSERARVNVAGLVELVGADLADDCLTGFAASWRKQDVQIPEAGNTSTPIATLVALTGVTVEYQRGMQFPPLTSEEAEVAATLAMCELNSFPPWMDDLARAHPEAVRNVLRETLSREWNLVSDCDGVLRFAPYQTRRVAMMMKEIVFELSELGPPKNRKTCHSAVNALLVSHSEVDCAARLASQFAAQAEDDLAVCSEWARLWCHTAPIDAAAWVRATWTANAGLASALVARLAGLLGKDFERDGGRVSSNFFRPASVRAWLPLLIEGVRPEHDVHHAGVHVVEARDDAQRLRNSCLTALAKDGSPEALGVLKALSQTAMTPEYAANITQALFEHGKYAAEQAAEPWSVDAILEFERGREVTPTSRAALFAMVRKHIRQIGASQERGDFSYPELFEALLKRDLDEHNRAELPIQKWVAANLQLVSRGIYTIERETELANENEVDISATIPGVGRVPLEIKPIGKYSLNALKGTIENQLLAKYMAPREVTHGVLLLVQLEEKHYEVGGNRQGSFTDMVKALSEFAAGFTVTHGKSIAVETIALVRRAPNSHGVARVS